MGYQTYYVLNFSEVSEGQRKEVRDALKEIAGDYVADVIDGEGFEMKWYDHDKDMIELSRRFPGVLFVLWGEGEESRDFWVAYYLDGKIGGGPAEIVYPEFDPEQMSGRTPEEA